MTHRWDVTPKEAIAIQRELREKVRLEPLGASPTLIAGCDISANRFSNDVFAGFVVMTYPGLEIVDRSVVRDFAPFPYIPGLLSFREIPSLLRAWERLGTRPELVVVDGVGIAHPRRLGIASHLGVLLDVPTIGCAKSVLTGVYEEPGIEAGSRSLLVDRKDPAEVLGTVLRTKRKVKPVFVSPGHRITIEESADLVASCVRKHRIPEPTRLAHEVMNEWRRNARDA